MFLDERPRLDQEHPDRVDRPRLQRRFLGLAAERITVLVGPAGSGKSELLRALRSDPRVIYFRVGNEHETFGRFVHGLAEAIAPFAAGAQVSFPRAWERALQSDSPGSVLAHWLCEHLNGIDQHIVIDDLHDGVEDLRIAEFIGTFAELRRHAPLTIAARKVGRLPVALWMATQRMERPIDETDLRCNRAEIVEAADRFRVRLAEHTVDKLLTATRGLPIAVAYSLTRLRSDPAIFSTTCMPDSFEGVAECIFARRTERERAFLFDAVLLPDVDDELLVRSGWDDAAAIRIAMGSDAPFIWERRARRYHFHDRFRDYLMQQFQSRDQEFRFAAAHRSVATLRMAGRHSDALDVATRQRLTGVAGDLLDAHGFEILECGAIDVISEALGAFADSERSLGASALALRGYLEARWGRLDTAEAWFSLGLANAKDETSRVAIAIYYARELAVRRREDACDVLEAFADSTTLPRSTLIDVRSSFGQALTAAGRFAEASSRTDEALELLEPDSPPALRARVFARSAYVALECDQPSLARERARIAAPLAVAQSLYDVAASTYSVLYNIAYDIDDDAAASRDYLDHIRDLGVKSGTLRFGLYVTLCMYQLHAEAGDETALMELDRALAAVDKHEAGTEVMETVLPAKALQAGWSGDFGAAELLLRPTADRQATPARKALCWAQIGLYCAAGGDRERAKEAFDKAQDPAARRAGTTQFGLMLLTLALGAWITGDQNGARRWLTAADESTIAAAPRLCALRDAIEALITNSADADGFAGIVRNALTKLRTVSFGGMAKLIEALPHPFAHGSETIGTVLASHELPNLLAQAVELDDAGSLRIWLDGLPAACFPTSILNERFEQWAATQAEANRHRAAAVRNVRRQLLAYRRPAPAIIRLVDDIDTSIDLLFEHLDAAAPLMAEHSRAVSAWCSRIGRVLGMSAQEITFITRCGLIHDIGKTRTPVAILQAARQLTTDEWVIMRDHAAEGARMIADQPLLQRFAPIIRGHHERLDGQGYPDGLRSGAIPVAARIVSVADCFNAMIGRRPYRPPMAPTDALAELERHRRTQFDPEIVEAMVRIVLSGTPQYPLGNP